MIVKGCGRTNGHQRGNYYAVSLHKTNFLKRSFSYRGAMAWNQLSNETREMGDLTSFKLAIS